MFFLKWPFFFFFSETFLRLAGHPINIYIYTYYVTAVLCLNLAFGPFSNEAHATRQANRWTRSALAQLIRLQSIRIIIVLEPGTRSQTRHAVARGYHPLCKKILTASINRAPNRKKSTFAESIGDLIAVSRGFF